MSFRFVKRLMFVLAAIALVSGAMGGPVRAFAAQTDVAVTAVGDDCLAMKMHQPCPVCKSGSCKMAASDCARIMCSGNIPGTEAHPVTVVMAVTYTAISYDDAPEALRGRTAEPALFPPKAA